MSLQALFVLSAVRRVPKAVGSLAFALGLAIAPAPSVAAPEMVSVARDEINMRAGAGTNHKGLFHLSRGYPLEVVGRSGRWIKVRDFEGDVGWVYRPLTDRSPHQVVRSTSANIRGGPGTRYRIVGRAGYGEVLRTLEKRPDWVKVRQSDGAVGWVARHLLWGW